jgi:two-component system chemotaxis response regulator CheB
MPASPIRAVLVEDPSDPTSDLARILQRDGDIRVTGQPSTGAAAIALVAKDRPDVVILDLQLSDGSGQHVIEQIMARTPTPILVLSSRIADRNSPTAVKAVVAGALDALPTPARWTKELEIELRRSVRRIRQVSTIRHPRGVLPRTALCRPASPRGRQSVVALAASTGGPSVLATILSGLGGLRAPVLVVQHIHADFISGLLDWMNRVSALPVEIAGHDQVARPGRVYLAPAGCHLRLGTGGRLELGAAPDTLHRPSADELLRSVATQARSAGVGVVLTGMGEDGAQGLLELYQQGGQTFAQDQASCAVFGMPRAAQRLGAVTRLLAPEQLAAAICKAVTEVRT